VKTYSKVLAFAAVLLSVRVLASAQSYSTYLGGSQLDQGGGIAVDAAGNIYVSGATSSPEFPTTPGAFDTTYNGVLDGFVAKFDPSGVLLWSTLIGGSGADGANRIAVDAVGNVYVAVLTRSSDFPTTAGAFDTTFGGGFIPIDAAFIKLNPAGTTLLYSTYLGGSEFDVPRALAIDGSGNAYIAGYTASGDFPTTPGALDPTNSCLDAFVSKINPNVSGAGSLVYSTYYGSDSGGCGSQEIGLGIAVDGEGNAYLVGSTTDPATPTTEGAFDRTHNGSYDAFVAKINAEGSALAYSTYLGGSGGDQALDVTVDAQGHAYVTGATESGDYPTTPSAFDTSHNGGYDVFVTKLGLAGETLVYSTYLGGSSIEVDPNVRDPLAISLDATGNAWVTGSTSSLDFPTSEDAMDKTFGGSYDGFLTKVDSSGASLLYSTYIGGTGYEEGRAVDVDANGIPWVTGATDSFDFPTTPGAFDRIHNGVFDVFLLSPHNHDPIITATSGPPGPISLRSPGIGLASVSASFSDVDGGDSHSCTFSWDDGATPTTTVGTVTETNGSGSCTGSFIYSEVGVYAVTVTVADSASGSDTAVYEFVVIYDPDGGFVTGGGWIDSPPGAYSGDPTLAGKATFGFVSKYKKGASVPTGETEFQFHAAALNFQSVSYDWLVIAGARAQYKGSGTINGAGDYGFLLTAIDGQINGGGGTDKLRIKIWDTASGGVVYDNKMGAPDDDPPTTVLGGGSIVVHKK
jgi:hypothetical protein